jgi:ligand-binding sensor protein
VGLSTTVLGGVVRFDSDSNSNAIQIVSKFDQLKKDLSKLEKFEIKYG